MSWCIDKFIDHVLNEWPQPEGKIAAAVALLIRELFKWPKSN